MIVTKTFPARKSFNNAFDELFGTFHSHVGSEITTYALTNIVESEGGYSVSVSAPGRSKENFKISVDKGLMEISYEAKETNPAQDSKFVRKEFVNGNFKRSFNLDEKINAEKIEAKYEDGVLKVFLPKKEELKDAARQISVQ